MTVRVRLFAGLRERAGWSSARSKRARSATCGTRSASATSRRLLLRRQPAVCASGDGTRRRRRGRAHPTRSGGAFLLSDEPLALDRVIDEVRDDEAGAIATFTGTTRISSRGRTVLYLDYEAYEGMAEAVMAEIAWISALAMGCAGRDPPPGGRVAIGGESVMIAVSRPHRADALAACRDAIDALKDACRSGRKRSTRAAKNGSGAARERRSLQRGLMDWIRTKRTTTTRSRRAPTGAAGRDKMLAR